MPARVLAAIMLQEKLGQNVVIENKTGGTGTLGVAYVARSTPDGYTLLANSLSDAQNLHFMPLPYDTVEDFAEIGWIVDGPPVVLVIDGNLPYKTLAELHRRREGQPGQVQLRHVRSGVVARDGGGAAQQGRAAPASCRVPYRGSGEAARGGGDRRGPGRLHVLLAGQAA